jgi:hypothetical protein
MLLKTKGVKKTQKYLKIFLDKISKYAILFDVEKTASTTAYTVEAFSF